MTENVVTQQKHYYFNQDIATEFKWIEITNIQYLRTFVSDTTMPILCKRCQTWITTPSPMPISSS